MSGWDVPARKVVSADGTPIAAFTTGRGPAIVLVHGATSDHTTFRVVRPLLEPRFTLHAIDRRGRGASGDGASYAVEQEFEDLAAVAEVVAADDGAPVGVVGHSFGGRVGLGAALRTDAIAWVVCYEGAPGAPGTSYKRSGIVDRLRAMLDRGDRASVLATFMTEVVGMPAQELERFRADPVWPARVAAAHTILRELEAETSPPASLEALGAVRQPVLQILGSLSRPVFRTATDGLQARLADGRVVVIDGARHGAHHTHPLAFVAAIDAFADEIARPRSAPS